MNFLLRLLAAFCFLLAMVGDWPGRGGTP